MKTIKKYQYPQQFLSQKKSQNIVQESKAKKQITKKRKKRQTLKPKNNVIFVEIKKTWCDECKTITTYWYGTLFSYTVIKIQMSKFYLKYLHFFGEKNLK